MKFSSGSKGSWVQPETGNTAATCIRIIDLGTQEREYQGKTSLRRQCLIVWELDGQADGDGTPLTISKFYTSSLSEKANLRKDLESWRGRPFTAEELSGFEAKNLIGKPCLLNLVQTQGAKGLRVGVSTISPLPKGMKAPSGTQNATYVYDVDAPSPEIWEQLSSGIQDIIRRCEEFKNVTTPVSEFSGEKYDDIPF